jgi:uncharacterized membrane protein
MAELIVVGFHGKHRAAEVLEQLQRLHEVDLEDAVAAYRRDDGKLRMEQSLNATGKQGAGLGGVIGLMVGALLAAPFTGGASAGVAAAAIGSSAAAMGSLGALMGADDASEWKKQFGISDDFVSQVGGMIQPGDSAVFALLTTSDPDKVANYFAGYGGTILRSTLTPGAEARLQAILQREPGPVARGARSHTMPHRGRRQV